MCHIQHLYYSNHNKLNLYFSFVDGPIQINLRAEQHTIPSFVHFNKMRTPDSSAFNPIASYDPFVHVFNGICKVLNGRFSLSKCRSMRFAISSPSLCSSQPAWWPTDDKCRWHRVYVPLRDLLPPSTANVINVITLAAQLLSWETTVRNTSI